MKLVIDTNILISALIKDSTTRKLILDSNLEFYYPWLSFHEIDRHKELILKKSKLDENDYNKVLLSLLKKVRIVPFHLIRSYMNKASKIMSKIDPDDVIFIATALAFNCPVWSDDAHFKKQHKIKIVTTSDILNFKMAFQKYLVIANKNDRAGENIINNLLQFKQSPLVSSLKNNADFDIFSVDDEIIHTRNLDLEKISKYDFVIFASKHKSESGEKSLSIHAPGNWRTAEFGGKDGKICQASALFMKKIFEVLNENVSKYDLEGYKVTLECTHHGPLIEKPCLFIEIGSGETEWADRRAGFVIAKTISDTIKEFKENPYNEIAIGIGGPHYCPNFNKLQLSSNVALSHIIPSYAAPITEEMIKEAISKTQEELDFAVLDWKGFNAEERQKVIEILEKNYIAWKKTSDIEK